MTLRAELVTGAPTQGQGGGDGGQQPRGVIGRVWIRALLFSDLGRRKPLVPCVFN